ncbi:4-hydroxyphenylpyruvate dioxygenase [Acidiferrimicrobium sp. IK]|uniref:4-hydroxyphenylpyruvate dioxygenase n=1 Tax=Acidiferrimicrobium sp. IK TaxID=2871700 RepID=UPI0021CB5482|nr:4-hydroxyphenylpyruvate dioxygenase [Acidiferrimicrobium sp. IK]MCU4185403.1 4-hydroxyphenylpyruvate dioxygenase [Acidiferrimicrobium sp. IK]
MTAVTTPVVARPAHLLRGWDCLELWVGNARAVAQLYVSAFGFSVTGYSGPETGRPERVSYVLEQGAIRLVVTAALDPADAVWDHVRLHGDGVRGLSFAVDDADAAFNAAVAHGATPVQSPAADTDERGKVVHAAVAGYGDTLHVFTERRHPGFAPGFSADGLIADRRAPRVGLEHIDHVVGNVGEGDLDRWVEFYRDVFGFEEMTHFDRDQISTEYSALRSTVMTNGRGVTMPINEPAPGRKRSQIQEYLDAYRGPGVQHVALHTPDIVTAVDAMTARGVRCLTPPPSYYDQARQRMAGLGDELAWEDLARLGIMVDREGDGYLLQVFTEPLGDRPTLFVEIIERHGAEGFGEGNFKALFEAIEREQGRRGNL